VVANNRAWKLNYKALSGLYVSKSVILIWIERKSQFFLLAYPSFPRTPITINCYQLQNNQFRLNQKANQKANQNKAKGNKRKQTQNKQTNRQTNKQNTNKDKE